MASVRRTLSPMPHTGTSLGAEACSVASPLSRPSSSNSSNKVQTLLLGLFSTKYSRPHDRSKSKGQVWRRAIFHYLICFCFGIFVGLALFVSMNLSKDYQSEDQDFRFTKILVVPGNATSVAGRPPKTNDSVPIEPYLSKWDMSNGTFNDTIVLPQSFDQDSYKVFDKLLIIVTPTYARPFQAYYLNRLAYTLKLVPSPLLWIVVEMDSQSAETADTLRRSGVMYRHLVCSKNLTEIKDRSLHQRNVALAHIETHQLDGIVYFADDNNICSTELFEQMRQIRRFGTWTVAKLVPDEGQIVLEGPVCNGTQVVGWHTDDNVTRRFRRFHVQMSGFAFNSTVLWNTKRWHRPTLEPIRMIDTVKELFQVSEFVEQVVEDESQMEGLPQDCSKVMIWQLHIESPFSYSYPTEWLMKNNLDAVAPLVQEF